MLCVDGIRSVFVFALFFFWGVCLEFCSKETFGAVMGSACIRAAGHDGHDGRPSQVSIKDVSPHLLLWNREVRSADRHSSTISSADIVLSPLLITMDSECHAQQSDALSGLSLLHSSKSSGSGGAHTARWLYSPYFTGAAMQRAQRLKEISWW